MLGFLRRGGLTSEQRVDLHDYLRNVRPLAEALEREYASWLEVAAENTGKLSLVRDPDGQHAAVYLWRVGDHARRFVQREAAPGAQHYFEAYALCLEARAAAAALLKEAAGTGEQNKPQVKVRAANEKLGESQGLLTRARIELRELEARLAAR